MAVSNRPETYCLTYFDWHNTFWSSEARHGFLAGVSGQRPEQGAAAKFSHSRKRGHKALTLHSDSQLVPRCW